MKKVKVKICGITNWADARCACEAGADFLGFNFYRESPRYISPARARRIVRRLPSRVHAVGVFVNEQQRNMLDTARSVGLRYLQLHGDESPDVVAALRQSFSVVKAVRVRKSFRPMELSKFKSASAILLDGFHSRVRGGGGKTFDWSLARCGKNRHPRIFLAGGITAENARNAILIARPYAIDVCSGVEAAPGKKDPAKIKALMRVVNGSRRASRKS